MRRPSPKQLFQELASEIFLVSWTLYKVMIPTLIVVKVLEEMGALVYLSWLLAPLMSLVGLPESMGIVWTATIMTNLYAGMLIDNILDLTRFNAIPPAFDHIVDAAKKF